MADRHSRTDEPDLIQDPGERAVAEARNALRQFDVGMVLLEHWLDSGAKGGRYLRPSDLLTLNRFAIEGVSKYAGVFRNGEVRIDGSKHQPPQPSLVPELVEDFCDYINSKWKDSSATELAAYALWRINWIHPFADGNGRTARIVSYVVLCAKLGLRLPGTITIPEQISADKVPYYVALEAADNAFENERIDVSEVERLLERCLEAQLESAIQVPIAGASREVITNVELLTRVQFLEDTLKTSRSRPISDFIERNPILFTGVFGIVAAVIGSVLTILFSK